jgi:hypothetical protein
VRSNTCTGNLKFAGILTKLKMASVYPGFCSIYGLMVTSVTKGRTLTQKLPPKVKIDETYWHDHSDGTNIALVLVEFAMNYCKNYCQSYIVSNPFVTYTRTGRRGSASWRRKDRLFQHSQHLGLNSDQREVCIVEFPSILR